MLRTPRPIRQTDSAPRPPSGLADARRQVAESDFGSFRSLAAATFRSLAATICLAMTFAVAAAEKRRETTG
jgi:hypothetical protein